LPSEALTRGDTFDLFVLDVAMKHQIYLNDKAQGKTTGAPRPSEAEMLKMLEKVRKENQK